MVSGTTPLNLNKTVKSQLINGRSLKACTKSIVVDGYARQHPEQMKKMITDPKTRRDLELKFFLQTDAQNVLTYYPLTYTLS